MNNEELYKEIDLIQNCIERMAKNSFMVKGWCLTLFAGVFAITKQELMNSLLLLISSVFIPFLCFWLLDTYFLRTEREFRMLYKWVLNNRLNGNKEYQYDLNPTRFEDKVGCWFKTMFSITLLFFYSIPLFVIVIFLLFKVLK